MLSCFRLSQTFSAETLESPVVNPEIGEVIRECCSESNKAPRRLRERHLSLFLRRRPPAGCRMTCEVSHPDLPI